MHSTSLTVSTVLPGAPPSSHCSLRVLSFRRSRVSPGSPLERLWRFSFSTFRQQNSLWVTKGASFWDTYSGLSHSLLWRPILHPAFLSRRRSSGHFLSSTHSL